MRAGILFLFILLGVSTSFSATNRWYTSETEAFKAARNQGKLVFMLAGDTSTCPTCANMRTTYTEAPQVQPILEEAFICWFIDIKVLGTSGWNRAWDYINTYAGYPNSWWQATPLWVIIEPGDHPTTTGNDPNLLVIGQSYAHPTQYNGGIPPLPTILKSTLLNNDTKIDATPDTAGNIKLKWNTEADSHFRVLKTTDFQTWSFTGGLLDGSGTDLEFTEPAGATPSFYRLLRYKN